MIPPPLGLVQSLVTYAEQVGSAEDLIQWRGELFTRLRSGQGKELVNASSNGKMTGYWLTISVEAMFGAVVKAIEIYNDDAGSSPITFLDFSQISGPGGMPGGGPII